MTLPSGTVEYTLGTAPARLSGGQVTGCGISWTAEELRVHDAAMFVEEYEEE